MSAIVRDMLLSGMTSVAVSERTGVPISDVRRIDGLLWSSIESIAVDVHRRRLAGASAAAIAAAIVADEREVALALQVHEHHRWDVVLVVGDQRIELTEAGLPRLRAEIARLSEESA